MSQLYNEMKTKHSPIFENSSEKCLSELFNQLAIGTKTDSESESTICVMEQFFASKQLGALISDGAVEKSIFHLSHLRVHAALALTLIQHERESDTFHSDKSRE
jgi:hypothetical protein